MTVVSQKFDLTIIACANTDVFARALEDLHFHLQKAKRQKCEAVKIKQKRRKFSKRGISRELYE